MTMTGIHPVGQTGKSRIKPGKSRVFSNKSDHFRAGRIAPSTNFKEDKVMAFFNSAIGVLQTLVVALGAGLGVWGAINLLEGYGNDNPGAKSQGMKQFMAN